MIPKGSKAPGGEWRSEEGSGSAGYDPDNGLWMRIRPSGAKSAGRREVYSRTGSVGAGVAAKKQAGSVDLSVVTRKREVALDE